MNTTMYRQNNVSSAFVMVIFGATGDLTQRKLIPALYHLFKKNILPQWFYIVGFSRRPYAQEDFKDFIINSIRTYGHGFDDESIQAFCGKCYYLQGDFDTENKYSDLADMLGEFDNHLKACVPRLFYLATPPDKYSVILENLAGSKLSEGCGQGSDKWTKILIEKPFGRSLEDSMKLDLKLSEIFKEDQIYRIDHYLGKETVQNILAFRFGNTIFEPVWNRHFIDHVQITIAETLGVETRGNFYEGVGALRDMVQSHLLELMAAVTMPQPQRFDAEAIRKSRIKSISQIVPIKAVEVKNYVVRGQYGVGGGTDVGYRQEANVDRASMTETFVALKLNSADKNWRGVPFYLCTGKRLAEKRTQIVIVFKEPDLKMMGKPEIDANRLRIRIEPYEGIEITLNAKKVGLNHMFEQVPMSFNYTKDQHLADAYEKILIDAMHGEQTLFTHTQEVTAAWKLVSPIAKVWQKDHSVRFPNYDSGTWGPKEAEELVKKDGREWIIK